MSARRRFVLVLAHALATFLAQPQPLGFSPGGDRVLDLGVVSGPLAVLFLLLALQGLAPRRALGVGFAAGLVAHAAVLHWIYVVTVVYGHAPPAAGVAAVLGLAAFVAAFSAAFSLARVWLVVRGVSSPFVVAALWTAADHLRCFAFTGFPWASLGYSQHGNPLLLALAPFAGVYGLGFAVALAGAAAADVVLGARRRAAPALVALLALHAVGALLAARPLPAAQQSLRVAVLQGSIDQGVKWSPEWADRTLSIYEELTRAAAAEGARVVVWPETAAPGSPDTNPGLRARLAALAREAGVALVVGAVGVEGWDPEAEEPRGPVRLYDSAYLLDAEGRFVDRYDKTHLVPFGEYVPLRWLLGKAVRGIATGAAGSDVSAGAAPRAVRVPLAGPEAGDVTAGVPICYELLFPDLVRRFVGDGARVLFAITNDAWYGRTGAPYQFLAITALRSAETATWTARAANTGVSAFIDERGRVRGRTPIFERGFLMEDVPLRPARSGETFYVRHGDWLARGSWLAAALAVGVALRRGRGTLESRRTSS
jgi:apolipoprotein N-acyltransferase